MTRLKTRKPGRPRKYGQGRINATVRFTPERYAQLKKAADSQGRSVSEEVEARVAQSVFEEGLTDIRRGLAQVDSDLQAMSAELLEMTVERIVKLEQAQALNEEAIGRTVEAAVVRAFTKARLTIGGEGQ